MTIAYIPKSAADCKKSGTDVSFLYDAPGIKLQKLFKIGTLPNIITSTRDYVSGIEYNNGANDIIHNSEGMH